MKKEIICTVCPMGCRINVEGEGENVTSVEGYSCKRGEKYAASEFVNPVRILTTTIKTDSIKNPVIPVRSEQPVPKARLMDCMEVVRGCLAKVPVHTYDVLIENICGTGVNIVAAADLEK